MGHLLFRLTAGLLALSVTFPVGASPQASALPPMAEGPWRPHWDAPYCSISIGDIKQLAVSIWYVPGSSGVEIYFIGGPARVPDIGSVPLDRTLGPLARIAELDSSREARVHMGEGRPAVPATVLMGARGSNGVLGLAMTGADFFPNFPNSSELLVGQGRKSVGLHYAGANEALAELRRCSNAKLKEWGVDSVALSALKRFPQLRESSWVTGDDYPKDALAQKVGGTVAARLVTDASGKVRSCVVVSSSGVKSLDDITCRVALTRARYKPALGADGRPAPATFIGYANYSIEQ